MWQQGEAGSEQATSNSSDGLKTLAGAINNSVCVERALIKELARSARLLEEESRRRVSWC